MIDPSTLAANLERGTDGLWWPRTRSRVDYPDEGNAFCFQVEDHSFWFQHRNACILAAMSPRFRRAASLFDIGGGNGFVARALVAAGLPTPWSSSRAPEGARNARDPRTRSPSSVRRSTMRDLPKGRLPAAGLFDVLEHIEDDRAVLRTAGDVDRNPAAGST